MASVNDLRSKGLTGRLVVFAATSTCLGPVADGQDLSIKCDRLLTERLWVADIAHDDIFEGELFAGFQLFADLASPHDDVSTHSILGFLHERADSVDSKLGSRHVGSHGTSLQKRRCRASVCEMMQRLLRVADATGCANEAFRDLSDQGGQHCRGQLHLQLCNPNNPILKARFQNAKQQLFLQDWLLACSTYPHAPDLAGRLHAA